MKDHLLKAITMSIDDWASQCEIAALTEDPKPMLMHLAKSMRQARLILLDPGLAARIGIRKDNQSA
jgi:hypothetical protein